MENNSIDPNLLRDVAGAFATGITVVCVRDDKGDVHGMTANSFLSVSLDPPLVLFSVTHGTKLLDLISGGEELGISILSEKQMEMSDQFAGVNADPVPINFDRLLPTPILENSLAWYRVEVDRTIVVGDHDLIICKVIDLGRNEGKPLLYFSGYKSIGNSIVRYEK